MNYQEEKDAARERVKCLRIYLSLQAEPDKQAEIKKEMDRLQERYGLTGEFKEVK